MARPDSRMDSSTVKSLSKLAAAFVSARSTKFLPHSVGVSLCHEKKILCGIWKLYGFRSLCLRGHFVNHRGDYWAGDVPHRLKINPRERPQSKSSAKSDDLTSNQSLLRGVTPASFGARLPASAGISNSPATQNRYL